MLTQSTKEFLNKELSIWLTDGLIDRKAFDTISKRYESKKFSFFLLLKYLGIVGGFFAFLGIIGMLAALANNPGFSLLITTGIATFFFLLGLRFSMDAENRYPYSSKILLFLGLISLAGCLGQIAHMSHLQEEQTIVLFGVVGIPLVFLLAYRFKNGFLLLFGIIAFFHWVGSWHAMCGRSSYVFAIQDPRIMSLAALGVLAIGIVHERFLQEKTLRFFLLYESVSLYYLNMSLLILSIFHYYEQREMRLVWLALFTVAGFAQIVIGSRLQNGLFTGFGVTFVGINLFTRYHEYCWDVMHKGLFFLLGGTFLLVVGLWYERKNKRLSAKELQNGPKTE